MKPYSVFLAFVALCASVGIIAWLSRSGVSDQPVEEEYLGGPIVTNKENPLEISPSGPHPVAVVEEGVYDFGKMLLGDKASHSFVIRNDGQAPLKLELQKTTCKCTVPNLPEGAIPIGKSAEVVLDWETNALTESFSQIAILWSNDPEQEEIPLQITGEVAPIVQVRPPFPWTIGNIREDRPSTFSGLIVSGQETFNVVDVEASQDWLSAEFEPLTTEELEQFDLALGSGYRVIGTVRPEMVIGRFQETLTFRTDLKDDLVVSGSVIGARAGPFSIIGQNWHGHDMTVRMGEVAAADGKTVTVSLFTDRHDEPLKVKSVTSMPDVVQVTMEHDDSLQTPVKEKYDLTFTIAPDSRRGRFYDDEEIEVTITTNRAEMEQIRLNVEANIK